MKKTGGRKSRWTVPLNIYSNGINFQIYGIILGIVGLVLQLKIISENFLRTFLFFYLKRESVEG